MLKLRGFRLYNMIMWHDVEFVFRPGITHVCGRNRSGKTLLFRMLSMILRAQVVKRGSSLSRMPKGSKIELDFGSNDIDWHAALTPTVLSLTKAGKDQGSTGKQASRIALASTLAIPVQLFDSTIHVQGTVDHPLISVNSTPASRLAWVSSVLDLTDAYDSALVAIEEDLAEARTAETAIGVYDEERADITIPERLPSLKKVETALVAAREEHASYAEGVRWLDVLLEGTFEEPAWYAEHLKVARKKAKRIQGAITDARAYELEAERAAMVARLQEQLSALPSNGIDTATMERFIDVLRRYNEQIEQLHDAWEDTAGDRARSARLEAELDGVPKNLHDLLGAARAQSEHATKQIRSLKHVNGTQCPVCSATLTAKRQRELISESEDLLDRAGKRIVDLTRKARVLDDANTLRHRLAHIKEPPQVRLAKITAHYERLAENGYRARQIKQRLADLKRAAGTDLTPPEHTVAELEEQLRDVEARIERYTVDGASAERWWAAHARAVKIYGQRTDWSALKTQCDVLARRVEELAVRASEVRAERDRVQRDVDRVEKLDDSIDRLQPATEHIAELLELKEAMGRKGLRLTKVKELVADFCREFNTLIPLLWDEQFVLEIEVKESGLDVWATRNGVREDLHSLSGSETQGWKAITALSLIRLLPDRLRANAIVLDEIESYMDPETKERFVSNYLPMLRQHVDSVILVSPVSYADSSLVADHSFQVVKTGNISRLQAA